MELIYEASNFKIQIQWVLPFAILGFAGLYAVYKGKLFAKVIGLIALGICAFTLIHFVYGYMTIIETYKNGNYQTIKGKVENFQPASQGGEDREDEEQESFNIRRVHFSYGETFIQKFGYHRTSVRGGCFKKNGERFKIGYIPTKEDGNVIVKIEKIKDE